MDIINKKVIPIIESKYSDIKKLVLDSGGVIAGGSLLSLYHDDKVNDIDIYVNARNFKTIFGIIDPLSMNTRHTYIVPPYDESFFRQNGIIGRFCFSVFMNGNEYINIDIIVVKNNIELRSVVTNFDLTFCEIWYDGNTINATNPNDVITKSGNLRDSYMHRFRSHNQFTLLRLQKYIKNGYKIVNFDINDMDELYIALLDVGFELAEGNEEEESDDPDSNLNSIYNPINYNSINAYLKPDKHVTSNISADEYVSSHLFKGLVTNYRKNILISSNVINKIIKEELNMKVKAGDDLYEYIVRLSLFSKFSDFDGTMEYINKIISILSLGKSTSTSTSTHKQSPLNNEIKKQYYTYLISISIFPYIYPDFNHYDITSPIMLYTSIGVNKYYSLFLTALGSQGIHITDNEYKTIYMNEIVNEIDDIKIDESKIPPNCNDIIEMTTNKIDDVINDVSGMIILINYNGMGGEITDDDIMCYSKDSLKDIYEDTDNWFYECNGPLITGTQDKKMGFYNQTKYIKFPINYDGLNGFIEHHMFKKMMRYNSNIYYIVPKIDHNRVQVSITHSISYKNSYGPRAFMNFVSENHCQAGSIIMIYEFARCKDTKTCVKSMLNINSLFMNIYSK